MAIPVMILAFAAVLVIRALAVKGKPLGAEKRSVTAQQAESYARQLSKMLACETVSRKDSYDDTEFAKLRAVAAELFPLVHSRCEKMTFGEDCWVFCLPGEDTGRNILLMSHHDVVAAEGEWKYPPFAGTVAEGKIWGRGAVDTKTPLFAELTALEELLREGFRPACNVWIASSHNEETAGNGIPLANEYFKEQGITFELILDEGGGVIDPPIGGMACQKCAMTAIHEKGRHKVKLTASQAMSHTNLLPGKNLSPTERMAAFITDVSRKNGFIRRLNPLVRGMLEAMAPYASFPMKLIFANLWCFGPVLTLVLPRLSPQAGGLLGTTVSFRKLSSPDSNTCTAEAMLRSVYDTDFEKDLRWFTETAETYGIRVEKTEDWEYHPAADPTLPAFSVVERCIGEIFPDVPVIPFILPAGTDARTLTDVCPCVVRFAPIRLSREQLASVHSVDENMDITAVGDCVAFYRRLLEQYEERGRKL